MKLFSTLLKVGISNQLSILASRVSFTKIKKCKDVDLPVDTNDIYKLKTGFIKENHYLIVPKDCDIYVQKQEKKIISFKIIRKVNEQDVPMNTSTSKISCCIS